MNLTQMGLVFDVIGVCILWGAWRLRTNGWMSAPLVPAGDENSFHVAFGRLKQRARSWFEAGLGNVGPVALIVGFALQFIDQM